MQRFAAILLIVCYVALGSGAMERLHNAQHAAEDAAALAAEAAGQVGAPHEDDDHDHSPVHDESNCPLHLQLHLAVPLTAWAPLLICLGLFVAFLTLLSPCPVPRLAVAAIPCRGPPIR